MKILKAVKAIFILYILKASPFPCACRTRTGKYYDRSQLQFRTQKKTPPRKTI